VLAATHRQFALTTLLISHDPAEIACLADRVVELDLGRVVRVGPPVAPAALATVPGRVLAQLPGGRLRVQLPGGAVVEVSGAAGVGEEIALAINVARTL
jgi:molybdate transport system ATP-binding protein